MDERRAKSHVNLVAILHICFGALTIAIALTVFLLIQFAGGFIPPEEELAINILNSISVVVPVIVGIFGMIDLLAGVSLYSFKEWSRIFVIVVSAFNCLNIPIGTLKGGYSIWALMTPEVQALFEK